MGSSATSVVVNTMFKTFKSHLLFNGFDWGKGEKYQQIFSQLRLDVLVALSLRSTLLVLLRCSGISALELVDCAVPYQSAIELRQCQLLRLQFTGLVCACFVGIAVHQY